MPDSVTHPPFCDPRVCTDDGRNVDHRDAPLVWRPRADDVELTLSIHQADEGITTGCTRVHLSLSELLGDDRLTTLVMTPSEALWLAGTMTRRAMLAAGPDVVVVPPADVQGDR